MEANVPISRRSDMPYLGHIPAVKGATNILEQALRFPQLKAVSMVSSFAAVGDHFAAPWSQQGDRTYNEADWLPQTSTDCEQMTGAEPYAAVL